MADTSNLTNFLGDIADAIRTKKETTEPIPAENFDQEILSIEGGTDASDATALASDIIAPKTAYTAAGKITGTIIPTYEPEEALILDEYPIECDTTSTGDISRLLAVTEDGKWLLAPALTSEGENGLGVFSVINGNITLIEAYSFSYLGMTDVNYSLFSLSKTIGDNKRILWYTNVNSNILNARIIDFNDTINPISNTVYTYTTNGIIKNIVVNPNLSNQVFVARYQNGYVQWILICGFDVDTNSIITIYPEQQLNLWNAGNFHPIHVSADGTKIVFGGTNAGQRAYDAYLFSLDSSTGRILSTKQFYGSSGNTGLSPDGKYAIVWKNFFKLDGTSYTFIGTTVWAMSEQYGYMFTGASNHIVAVNADRVTVYDIDLNTGNQNNTLFDIYTYGIANNVTNQNELWMLSSDRTKIKRIYSNTPLSGFKRNGIDYRDTSDATASIDDIISPETAYVNGEKITGNITRGYSSYNNTNNTFVYNDVLYKLTLPSSYVDYVVFRGTDGNFWLSGCTSNSDKITYKINDRNTGHINIMYIKGTDAMKEYRLYSTDMKNWTQRDEGYDGYIRTNVEQFLYSTREIYGSNGEVVFNGTSESEYTESLQRLSTKFYNTAVESTGLAEHLTQGKIMYNGSGKVLGTLQVGLTVDDYNTCDNLASLILGDTPIIDDPNISVTLDVSNNDSISINENTLIIEEASE